MIIEKDYQEVKNMLPEIIYLDEDRVLMDILTGDKFFIELRSYLYRFTHILNLYKYRKITEQETYDLFKELFYQITDTVFLYKNSTHVSANLINLHLHVLILKCFTKRARLVSLNAEKYYEDVYNELKEKENEKIIRNYLAQ